MPEQQASPSCSQPPPSVSGNAPDSTLQADESVPSDSAKRTYLSLLPPPQLIDLILAIDADRDTRIFPLDLHGAIEALQRPRQATPASVDVDTTSPVKTEPTVTTALPPPPLPSLSVPPPEQTASPTPAPSTAPPPPPAAPQPVVSPPASAPVLPPQYKPPPHKLQSHPVPQMYPHTHMPYYAPTVVPIPPNPQASSSPVPPPTAPPRHPLFTSAPLNRDSTKPPTAKPTPTPTLVSSRDDPNAMPSYEEMIVEAIIDVGDTDGTAPKVLFAWMASHYPLQQNFRPSASQALHKALRRGRLAKVGGKYRLNPEWGGGPTTSKRATRRPMPSNATMSPPAPTPTTTPPTTIPAPMYHPTYGYYHAAHPSLHPIPYYAGTWIPSHQVVQPPAPIPSTIEKTEEMEEDVLDSEEVDSTHITFKSDNASKERMKQSLARLVRVLKRFAEKGEGTIADISVSSGS